MSALGRSSVLLGVRASTRSGRRSRSAVLAALGLLLATSACNDDDSEDSRLPTGTPATTASAPTTFDRASASSTVVEVPAGSRVTGSGQTIATPVGDINWTRVDGDASSLPQEILFEIDGRYFGVDDAGTSWRSDDARSWIETDPLPDGDRNFVDFEGVWTILDSPDPSQPPRLGWWERASSGVAELPGWGEWPVQGLRVTDRGAHIGMIAYELLVIETATYGLDPVNDVVQLGGGVDESDIDIRWVDDHTYQVITMEDGISRQIGPDLTLSGHPSNPRVVRITSPDGLAGQVGPWPGLDADQLISRLRTGHLERRRELHIGNRATHFFTAADALADDEIVEFTGRIGRDGSGVGFAVVAEADGSGLSLVVDGERWVDGQRDEIPMSRADPITSMTIAGSERGAVLYLELDSPLRAETWFTTGGVWSPTNAPQYLGGVAASDFGWVKHSREEFLSLEQLTTDGYPLSLSADGTDWQNISIGLDIDPEIADQPPAVTVTVARNKIFVSVDDGDERTLWIGDVDHA